MQTTRYPSNIARKLEATTRPKRRRLLLQKLGKVANADIRTLRLERERKQARELAEQKLQAAEVAAKVIELEKKTALCPSWIADLEDDL